jgi:hypothetical protein
MSLLKGSLFQAVICKKAGWLFNPKWVPFLSPNRLKQLGLHEKAHTLLDLGDGDALLTDADIMTCAYRPGSNPEGMIIEVDNKDQFRSFLVGWLRESGVGDQIFPSQQLQGASGFTFNVKLGMFSDWAMQYLIEIGPEISPKAFHEAVLRALKRAGLAV